MPPKELAKEILRTEKAMLLAVKEMYDYLLTMPQWKADDPVAEETGRLVEEIGGILGESQNAVINIAQMLVNWQV
jgi:hypothetical protein